MEDYDQRAARLLMNNAVGVLIRAIGGLDEIDAGDRDTIIAMSIRRARRHLDDAEKALAAEIEECAKGG